jgi:heptosyltransferase II
MKGQWFSGFAELPKPYTGWIVEFNPSSLSRVMVRATNWLGDAVMSLPAIRAIRDIFPRAHLAVVAKPWVADLYAREKSIGRVIPYTAKTFGEKRAFAAQLRRERFDGAILLQNAFDAALMAWMAGIPERIGYRRDGRGFLLTRAIPVPEPGDIPRHERFYYLELLRRAGMLERFPTGAAIQLDGAEAARECGLQRLREMGITKPPIGISPGAAYGNAKRWLPERFAEAAARIAGTHAAAALVFGSTAERQLCEVVTASMRSAGMEVWNLAGETSLSEFIELAAACRVFLSNDSGAMHVASALGVPVAAVFGATDDTTTGPSSPLARVIRAHAECSPCLLRDCPIDHRCMARVSADSVAAVAQELWEVSAPASASETWTPEKR